jgi:hypothetical protein
MHYLREGHRFSENYVDEKLILGTGNGRSWVVNCVRGTEESRRRTLNVEGTWTWAMGLVFLYRKTVFRMWVVFPS